MRRALFASTAIALLGFMTTAASAAVILTFGQTSGTPITATENGAQTSTTLSALNAPISVTQIENGVATAAFFDLNATSTGPAITIGTGAAQHYAGSFSITTASGGGGTNLLSGNFTDLAFGAGQGGALAAGAPPDTISFTSSVITHLQPPSAIGLAFANVVPGFAITGTSIGSFTSSVSGTFSANTPEVAEPATIAILGVGILGLAFVSSRKRRHTLEADGAA